MSATRTFTVLKASAFISGDDWTFTVGDNCRQALDISAYLGMQPDFGGSEDSGIITGAATWVPVRGRRKFTLNGSSLGGLTLDAVVSYKTASASTAVQVRVRNLTDSSNAALGTSSVSTTIVDETLTLTLASGDKVYELEVLGDATNPVFAWGYWRIRKVPV